MSLHTSAPPPSSPLPGFTAQPQQPFSPAPSSSSSSSSLLCRSPFSHFSCLPPCPSKVLINSQYSWEVLETPTLLSHLPTATLIRATGCTAQSLSRLRSSGSFIHGLYFRCGGQVHGGMNSSSVLLCLLLSCALHSVPPLPPTPKVSATPLTHLK